MLWKCVCVWLIHEGKHGFKQPTLPESLCQVAKDCPSCHIALPGFWWQGNTLESHRIGPAVGGSQRSSIIFCFPNSMSPISCTCQLGPKAWHRSLAPNNHLQGAAERPCPGLDHSLCTGITLRSATKIPTLSHMRHVLCLRSSTRSFLT